MEYHPDTLSSFETANQLPARTLQIYTGTHQTNPNGPTGGTGNQFYYSGVKWAPTDRVQLGASYLFFEDPPGFPIGGAFPDTQVAALAVTGKFRLYQGQRLTIAAVGSIERFSFKSNIFGSRNDNSSLQIVKSLHIPFTYAVSDSLQFHVTPAVSIFTNTVNGIPFYGTNTSVGTGVSWKPNRRLVTYATASFPVGSGGNTITNTAAIAKRPVWAVGARFNISPKSALDVYATNGLGSTPGTGILTFFPDANILLVGAKLIYTPGKRKGYRPNYRGIVAHPLSPRNQQLQNDGFTLASADTLSAGTVQGTFTRGTHGNVSAALVISPDHDGQIEGMLERYANDGSVAPTSIPNAITRYMFGAKLRLLDQNNGSKFSLSVRALVGRDFEFGNTGVLYFDMPTSYKASDRLTLTAAPKFAAFGGQRKVGVGLGVNYEVLRGLQLIGEVTPVAFGDRFVWAAGAQYTIKGTPIRIDLHATNAIGRYGIGTMVGQSETKIALGASLRLNFAKR